MLPQQGCFKETTVLGTFALFCAVLISNTFSFHQKVLRSWISMGSSRPGKITSSGPASSEIVKGLS